MITARFFVENFKRAAYNPQHLLVVLSAAGRGEQNKAWTEATPSGKLEMSINNPAAAKWFAERLGRDIAMTFDDIEGDTPHTSPHSP